MACTVFAPGCNFRCPFCHNASLVLPERAVDEIPQSEFFAFLEKRVGILDGVCITGGEPLLQPGLTDFLRRIRAMGFQIKLDTNGAFPDRLRALAEAGLLEYVAMDLIISPARYAETVGLPAFDLSFVRESVDWLLEGHLPYEFRTTVVRQLHTAEDLLAIADWIRGAERYFLQAFVDSGDVLSSNLSGYDKQEMEVFADLIRPILPQVEVRGL